MAKRYPPSWQGNGAEAGEFLLGGVTSKAWLALKRCGGLPSAEPGPEVWLRQISWPLVKRTAISPSRPGVTLRTRGSQTTTPSEFSRPERLPQQRRQSPRRPRSLGFALARSGGVGAHLGWHSRADITLGRLILSRLVGKSTLWELAPKIATPNFGKSLDPCKARRRHRTHSTAVWPLLPPWPLLFATPRLHGTGQGETHQEIS